MQAFKTRLKKICSLFRKKGFLATLFFVFGRLVFKFNRHVVYEANLDRALCVSRWGTDENIFNFGPDDLRHIYEDNGLVEFLGGELAEEYLEGVARGDRLFVVRNKQGYAYYGFIIFDTRQTKIIGEWQKAPFIANCFTAESERGKGVYRRALNDKLVYLQRLGYKRAIVEVHPDNYASRKGIEAAPFHLCREMATCLLFYKIAIQFIKTNRGYNVRIVIV